MPIDENIIRPLLEDTIRERDIPVHAIKIWTEPKLSVYVATVTIKPSENAGQDLWRGKLLLKHTIKWALTLQRQYDIKNWYGIGATEKGQRLFEALGFQEIVSLYNGQRKGYFLENATLQPVRILNQMLEEQG
jgi:hypothetical protein